MEITIQGYLVMVFFAYCLFEAAGLSFTWDDKKAPRWVFAMIWPLTVVLMIGALWYSDKCGDDE